MMRKYLIAAALTALVAVLSVGMVGCANNAASSQQASDQSASNQSASSQASDQKADQEAADMVAQMIDAIYVQKWTDDTPEKCQAAKAGWDKLTDAQKELVEGEFASPDYFGLDTGDASLDDPLNSDNIGEKEILVVSFGTSYNDSRASDIGGIEKAIIAAYPDWSVRRAFSSQIIINHILARDGVQIDNVAQALDRAVANGVKTLVIQPTHLMHGTEYDELIETTKNYESQMSIVIAEPLLGELGNDASVINADKEAVAKAATQDTFESSGFDSLDAAAQKKTAFVLVGHGTSHVAKVSYSQMQTQLETLGYTNVFVGTVEGEPEETACENVVKAVAGAGYTNVVLRPLMVVAGDHANNDIGDVEDEESWISLFAADPAIDGVECQIAGLGEIPAIQELYVAHTAQAMAGIS